LDEPCGSPPSDNLYEELCTIADDAARKYIASKVSSKEISDLTVAVSLEESKGMNVEVDVELTLSSAKSPMDEKKLAEGAVKAAFRAIDEYVGEVNCRSRI